MSTGIFRGAVFSDFNAETFAAYLNNDSNFPAIHCVPAPYGQVRQQLLNSDDPVWKDSLDFAIVWTRPEAVLEEIKNLMDGGGFDAPTLDAQVDAFAELLSGAAGRIRSLFVPTWTVPGLHLGHGLLDLNAQFGVSRGVMQANLRLLTNIDQIPGAFALNAAKWVELAGGGAFSPRSWYLTKMPFGVELLKAAMRDVQSALRGIYGLARKVVVLDLDDTLWGGIVGDVGWQELSLGGHSPAGEAFQEFQRLLKALTQRGVVLAIASKNEESVALEAIRMHPEMVLRMDDFGAWRINWKDKAQNIAELAIELNVGLDSMVFIDDDKVERARVRQALPNVLTPEWPADPRLYPAALRSLDCFDKPSVSAEDRKRSEMYGTARRREETKASVGSVEDWLQSLDICVSVEGVGRANIGRLVQLLNKTNQMNLSTRRMNEKEFQVWMRSSNRRIWLFRVQDKFGNSGITGILSVEIAEGRGRIVDFVLSCRVMGRRIEEAMLHVAAAWARNMRCTKLEAPYVATAKNKPCFEFLCRSRLQRGHNDTFVWDNNADYPLPSVLRLEEQSLLECVKG